MAAKTEPFSQGSDHDLPLITQSVATVFAVFGLLAALGLGWMLARSTAGLPPFQLPAKGSTAAQPAGTAAAQTLHLTATEFRFDTKELHLASPGTVAVQLENRGLIDHDLTIEGVRFTLPAAPGKTAEKTLKLEKPGTYTFYCSLPGHREAGMSGTLVVGDGKSGAASAATSTTAGTTGAMGTMPGMGASMGRSMGVDTAAPASHAATVAAESKGNQLLEPALDGQTKVFRLTAQVVQWEVVPGVRQEAWTYNSQLPGPLIRVTEGDRVRVELKNDLPEPTIIHFHGPRTPNAQDGVPDVTQPAIPPGGTYTYEFVAEPAGTYIYHSHYNSAVQEPKGLYGILIIDPKPGSAEAQRDAQYAHDYLQVLSEFGGYFVINGHAFPATEPLEAKVGERVRLRLINIGQTIHPMHLHGYHFRIVGTDGVPVEGPPLVKDTLSIAPGERYDLEFLADNPGTWLFHCHILAHVTNQGVEPGGMISILKVTE